MEEGIPRTLNVFALVLRGAALSVFGRCSISRPRPPCNVEPHTYLGSRPRTLNCLFAYRSCPFAKNGCSRLVYRVSHRAPRTRTRLRPFALLKLLDPGNHPLNLALLLRQNRGRYEDRPRIVA